MDFSKVSSPGVSDATIGPRDLLKITVTSGRDREMATPVMVRVAQDGTVNVPLIGPAQVAGAEAHEAGQRIAEAAIQRGIYVQPYVTVEMQAKAVKSVTVLGAVNEPGVHELPYGNCHLVTALAAAGGMSEEAGTEIEIIRQAEVGLTASQSPPPTEGGETQLAAYQPYDGPSSVRPTELQVASSSGQPQVLRLDLSEGRMGNSADTRLNDRDIVKVIPRQPDVIFVTGLVNKPGQFDLPLGQDIHLLDAIAMAGGQSSLVADKILVIRRLDDESQPVLISASMSAAKRNGSENIRIAPGDTVSIEQTPTTILVGTFQQLFRFSFGVASRTTSF